MIAATTIHWMLLAVGWVAALIWAYHAFRLFRHIWTHTALDKLPIAEIGKDSPSVCVIVPACNEEVAIERCLRSLIAQDYPNLRIVAVNDRSTDETGTIMDRVSAESDRLTVIHIDSLPAGWLGKNHANHVGINSPVAAACDYILFTDGDIFFDDDCIRRAVRHVLDLQLDHLALMPHLVATGFAEKVMCHFFGVCFLLKCRIWNVENPKALNAFSGVGAFNLVRRSAYEAMGGHEALRLEALDDYKLGKLMKHSGAKCRSVDSGGKIRVRWQIGLGGIVRGFEKNAFAGCDYSPLMVLHSTALMIGAFIAPYVCALTVSGNARWGWVVAAVLQLVTLTRVGMSFGMAVFSPLCAMLMIWSLVRAMVLTYIRGGTIWRGTLYRLDELRKGMV